MKQQLEPRQCLVCKKIFIPTRESNLMCGPECKHTRQLEMASKRAEKKKEQKKADKMKKEQKKLTITDIAVMARKAGMTYGQYVAQIEGRMNLEKSRRNDAGRNQKLHRE